MIGALAVMNTMLLAIVERRQEFALLAAIGWHPGRVARLVPGFERFPTWMWRNADVLDFVGWLRAHNERAPRSVGFYGLDLYSLYRSIEAVVTYLEEIDPSAAERARRCYECFERFEESQAYGYAVVRGISEPCRRAVVRQLFELLRSAGDYLRRDGIAAEDEQFYAEQNARLVLNAEEYYRTMFDGAEPSWNLRDRHMADTLDRLLAHLDRHDDETRAVVWAHNSHVGDARKTEMSRRGELNVGQLARERHGRDARLIGFTTYEGSVSAASDWDAPVERKRVRPALAGSYEALFHETGIAAFWLPLGDLGRAAVALRKPRLERAIGVPRPSARATTSAPAWPTSSTPLSTSIARAPSSRSTGPSPGSAASRRRPTRPRCETSVKRVVAGYHGSRGCRAARCRERLPRARPARPGGGRARRPADRRLESP